jgi:hypothetical protein
MRSLFKLLAVAAVTASFAAPAPAGGFIGGGGPGNGGPPGSVGVGPEWIPPGGGGAGPDAQPGLNRGPNGGAPPAHRGPNTGFKPPNPGGPNPNFRPPRRGAGPNFSGHGHDGDEWRRRPRHYWLGGGPIFVPDPSGDYVYSDDDYDDGSDPTGCWVYRKAYDSGGAFLGFVHIDSCQHQ